METSLRQKRRKPRQFNRGLWGLWRLLNASTAAIQAKCTVQNAKTLILNSLLLMECYVFHLSLKCATSVYDNSVCFVHKTCLPSLSCGKHKLLCVSETMFQV